MSILSYIIIFLLLLTGASVLLLTMNKSNRMSLKWIYFEMAMVFTMAPLFLLDKTAWRKALVMSSSCEEVKATNKLVSNLETASSYQVLPHIGWLFDHNFMRDLASEVPTYTPIFLTQGNLTNACPLFNLLCFRINSYKEIENWCSNSSKGYTSCNLLSNGNSTHEVK